MVYDFDLEASRRAQRVNRKNLSAMALVRTNIARALVYRLIDIDDKIQEIASMSVEITPDNIVSKSIRKLFGIFLPVEAPPAADKTAKSKWHEILQRADKRNFEEREGQLERLREQMALELSQNKSATIPAGYADVLRDLAALHPEDKDVIEAFQKNYPGHVSLTRK